MTDLGVSLNVDSLAWLELGHLDGGCCCPNLGGVLREGGRRSQQQVQCSDSKLLANVDFYQPYTPPAVVCFSVVRHGYFLASQLSSQPPASVLTLAQSGSLRPYTWALRMAAAWTKEACEGSVPSNTRGRGKRLGADQKGAPVEVVASSGKVKVSCRR
jgi:hypothetical protein